MMCNAAKNAVLMISNCELSHRMDIFESRLNNLCSEIQDCCEDLRERSSTEVPPEIVSSLQEDILDSAACIAVESLPGEMDDFRTSLHTTQQMTERSAELGNKYD